jgi:broad specificity phosphatase PhoE
MICNISYITENSGILSSLYTTLFESSSSKLYILISFKYGILFNYFENKSYFMIFTKINEYKLYSIKKNNLGTSYETENIKILKLDYKPLEVDKRKSTIVKWVVTDINDNIEFIIHNLQLRPDNNDNSNKKLLILVRHGVSLANLSYNYNLNPNHLSENGKIQCEKLASELKIFNDHLTSQIDTDLLKNYKKGITLAVFSPLERATQTGFISLEKIILDRILTKELNFLCTETVGSYSDVRTDYETYNITYGDKIKIDKVHYKQWHHLLWKDFPSLKKFNELTQYTTDSIEFDPSKIQLNNDKLIEFYRPKLFFDYIKSKTDNVIIVFTHSVFISNFLQHALGMPQFFPSNDNSVGLEKNAFNSYYDYKELYPYLIDNTNLITLLID